MVGLGTWQSFDVGSSARVRAPLKDVLRTLFDCGGSVIDSSPMYGRAQRVVGDLLSEMNEHRRAFVATQVWTEGSASGVLQMTESMGLLRVASVDLMQVHNLLDWRTHMATLGDWKRDGRIRYLGVTHYTRAAFDSLARIVESERLDFVQRPYSIAMREAEDRLLPLCAERGTAVLVNRPYEGGGLFRAVRRRKLPEWAGDFGAASWGQFFLKYILGQPAVTCVIPGTAKAAHMRDNAAAGLGRLPDARLRRRMVALVGNL